MEVLTNLIVVSFCNIHMYQIITLYTLHLHIICQLYFNKPGEKVEWEQLMESNDQSLNCFLEVAQSHGKILIEKWHKKSWPSFPGVEDIFIQGFQEIFQVPFVFELVVFIVDASMPALPGQGLCQLHGCSPWNLPPTPQGLTPRGLPVDVYCMEWELTFALTVSLVPLTQVNAFPQAHEFRKKADSPRVTSYFLTKETEGRLTELPIKHSLMSCNYNKE